MREVVALWNEILPDDFLVRPRLLRIYYAGKFYAYPLKAFEALRNLGLAQSIRCLASYVYARAFPVRDPKTFHQWMRNHFDERFFSISFKTYTEKVWGMDCDEISADWAAQRIKGLDVSKHSPMACGAPWELSRKGGYRQDLDRIVSLSAPRPRHDVGSCRAQNSRERRPHRHGPQIREAALRSRAANLGGGHD